MSSKVVSLCMNLSVLLHFVLNVSNVLSFFLLNGVQGLKHDIILQGY